MNPHLRARTDMPLTKHLSHNEEQKMDSVGDRNIKNVAFSVKTACTLFIVCDGLVLSGRPCGTAGLLYCLLLHCRCQQCVRSGSAADWQTVPLQPAANQPVSNTCCY